MPCVPVEFHLKYDPPKIALVYHFERNVKEKFYHEINITKRMLENDTDEDICSHLYMSETYYFDPKKIKR